MEVPCRCNAPAGLFVIIGLSALGLLLAESVRPVTPIPEVSHMYMPHWIGSHNVHPLNQQIGAIKDSPLSHTFSTRQKSISIN